jgi:hypothetical protein
MAMAFESRTSGQWFRVVYALAVALPGATYLRSGPTVHGDPRDELGIPDDLNGTPGSLEYVGMKKCRMCHVDQFRSWKESLHAGAWDALRSGHSVEIKRQAGLDPVVEYTTDSRCLRCHATGFGEAGGYAIPDPKDKQAVTQAASREGVTCEACHGPGSGFVSLMQEVNRTGRTYRLDEFTAAGRREVTAEVCGQCHNQQALCMNGGDGNASSEPKPWLNVQVHDRRASHAAFALKHRESGTAADGEKSPPQK